MSGLIIGTLSAACMVVVVWCFLRALLQKTPPNSRPDQIQMDDYLGKITRVTGHSVYDTFYKSAESWPISNDRVEKDFSIYLATQNVPYYVQDFIRKSQKNIDELYTGKGNNSDKKRLIVFYIFFTLLLWGGAVFLSLYVIPYFLPAEFQMFYYGPP